MKLIRTTFKAMGCDNEIVAGMESADGAKHAMGLAAREVLRIEHKYSRYRNDDGSIVSRINRGAGGVSPVECDPETIRLLKHADSLFALSDGSFDITSGILRRVWDFSKPVLPSRELVQPVLELIGWKKVELAVNSVRLPIKGMEIDFGGFGKEYAADRAAAVMAGAGVTSGYVNLGGDISVVGAQPDGSAWKFGVRDPRNADGIAGHIELISGGLATSGDYEKFVRIDGYHYCHILNPRTGFPVNCWRSVSVSSVSALRAGALSTIAMLKEADAVSFLNEADCRYLLIDAAGRRLVNEFAAKLE